MVVVFLKILVALYGAEKLIAAKDPARSFFDKIDFSANRFLISLKDEEVKTVLMKTSKSLVVFNVIMFLIFIISIFIFKPLPNEFVINWSILFVSTVFLNIAIPWNLDHIGFTKRFFISSPLMLIPATPILSLTLARIFHKFSTGTKFSQLARQCVVGSIIMRKNPMFFLPCTILGAIPPNPIAYHRAGAALTNH